MTLTCEIDTDFVKTNHRAEYLVQRLFHSKVIIRTIQRQAHTANRAHYPDH